MTALKTFVEAAAERTTGRLNRSLRTTWPCHKCDRVIITRRGSGYTFVATGVYEVFGYPFRWRVSKHTVIGIDERYSTSRLAAAVARRIINALYDFYPRDNPA